MSVETTVEGFVSPTIITCAAWLLELYEVRSGEIFFIIGEEEHPAGHETVRSLVSPILNHTTLD